MAEVSGQLGRLDLFKVVWRLLFMQALIHRRGMQNLALAGALDEVTDKVAGGDKTLIKRHLAFFNCNPNFVPLIAGGVLRLEEEKHAGKPITDEDIEYFKKALASPLAAMGDMLFLGSVKPLALTLACIFAIYKIPIGLLAVLLLYNLAILSCRPLGNLLRLHQGLGTRRRFFGSPFSTHPRSCPRARRRVWRSVGWSRSQPLAPRRTMDADCRHRPVGNHVLFAAKRSAGFLAGDCPFPGFRSYRTAVWLARGIAWTAFVRFGREWTRNDRIRSENKQ